jgi:polyhydroxyalkanoate synthesis regulator phasin
VAGDELFKRYLEIGASVLGMSRERAEGIVKDLVASGEVARGQATKAADWLVERGRTGTEELAELVRREVRQQVAALGLATKDDIARLEAELAAARSSAANAATPTAAAAAGPAAKAATTGRPVAKKPVAKDPVGTPSPPAGSPVGKAAKATGTGKATGTAKAARTAKAASGSGRRGDGDGGGAAGISRSGSVRRRSGGSGTLGSDPASPAGGAVPPKG